MFRLASLPMDRDPFADLELDSQGREELLEFLAQGGNDLGLDELLDGPFRPRRKRNPTRFSDGSFPVFYSALEAETAEAEMKHRVPNYVRSLEKPRPMYYSKFSCTFHGVEKDLRPQVREWPDLVHDNDYSFCNRIGAQARRLEVDGLVIWSARREGGVNLPVFSRRAISQPRPEGLVAMEYDPATKEVTVRQIEG